MRFLCVFLSVFLLSSCNKADATETNIPTLHVEYLQSDSVRVTARWSRPCDAKGCADSYRVQWQSAPTKTITRTADTAYFKKPQFGDTVVVRTAVTSIRRGVDGATKVAEAVIRNPDSPPPAVDSLRLDTLGYEAAMLDSFPVDVIRSTLGQKIPQEPFKHLMAVGDEFHICWLSRNRYTGEVRVMIPSEAPPNVDDDIAARCEVARQLFAAERDG